MKTDEIRKAFLEYFAQNGHAVVPSSSLIPAADPTLLFTNSGMVPFKDCFLGTDKRSYVRATSCQKSLRISGKHNDLENVGPSPRHHTFFEMLGNFSFGDYFKTEAIQFAWQFLTQVLKLPKNRLWVTIYEEDDEAGELWRKLTDVSPDRILKFGKEDNFWSMGETGPCGPSSEIFYFVPSDIENQSENDFRTTDGRYVEIWNLVFMSFDRDTAGNLTPLPKPSVDTGMGVERMASAIQGVSSNYDTDMLRSLISYISELSGMAYEGKNYTPRENDPQYTVDVAHRVVTDHVRACAALIADDVLPSSDGRGYVLRRLLRRACKHGRALGFHQPFLYKVAARFVELYGDAYPEFKNSAGKIQQIIQGEEEKFLQTLDSGLALLTKEVALVRERGSKQLPGEVAFLLHDTYGFPLDLTENIVRDEKLTVDSEGFSREMERQRDRSRQARAKDTELILQRAVKPSKTAFVGYDYVEYESTVVGLYDANGEVAHARAGDEVVVVTDETPFYGESGGQLGDTGSISSNDASLDVIDTQKVGGDTIVHICRVIDGGIQANSKVRLAIDAARRARLRANHSATHLLHLGLREVLGGHVKQAGSRVSDGTLRFDYSHFAALEQAQLDEIEAIVDEEIRANHPVVTEVLPVEEAKRTGAMALFGEKYGDMVRVVQIGPRSRELCGGTHVKRSGDIGSFGMLSEGGISSGVRRVEGVAGAAAFDEWQKQKKLLKELGQIFKVSDRDVLERVRKLVERTRVLEKEVERLSSTAHAAQGGKLGETVETSASGIQYVASFVENTSPKQLREMIDNLKNQLQSGCFALGSVADGKALLITAVTDDLTQKLHAGNLLTELTKIVGGKGGGRPDLAQAGGGDPEKIRDALSHFRNLIP